MTTETPVIISDRQINAGRLVRFAYRPASDAWLPSIVINGFRYFRHHSTRWGRIEGGQMLCLRANLAAIAENMHVEYINN